MKNKPKEKQAHGRTDFGMNTTGVKGYVYKKKGIPILSMLQSTPF